MVRPLRVSALNPGLSQAATKLSVLYSLLDNLKYAIDRLKT